MRETNHLYKKILNTAPFGTLFFAYGVCIDANQKALSILGCDHSELVGLSLNDSSEQQPPLLLQLKKVIARLENEQLQGLLWRSEHSLDSTELVVSLGAVENTDNVLSLMLLIHPCFFASAHPLRVEPTSPQFDRCYLGGFAKQSSHGQCQL